MLRAADIIAAVATSLNLPVSEVSWLARYLREQDLFVRETKSPRSWKAGPRDAAALFAAAMTGVTGARVAFAVQMLKDYTDPQEENQLVLPSITFVPGDDLPLFYNARNFLDAITALLVVCERSISKNLDRLTGSYVEYDATRMIGRIVFKYKSPPILASQPSVSTHILTFGSDDGTSGDIGALRRSAQIDISAFRQVGTVLVHSSGDD